MAWAWIKKVESSIDEALGIPEENVGNIEDLDVGGIFVSNGPTSLNKEISQKTTTTTTATNKSISKKELTREAVRSPIRTPPTRKVSKGAVSVDDMKWEDLLNSEALSTPKRQYTPSRRLTPTTSHKKSSSEVPKEQINKGNDSSGASKGDTPNFIPTITSLFPSKTYIGETEKNEGPKGTKEIDQEEKEIATIDKGGSEFIGEPISNKQNQQHSKNNGEDNNVELQEATTETPIDSTTDIPVDSVGTDAPCMSTETGESIYEEIDEHSYVGSEQSCDDIDSTSTVPEVQDTTDPIIIPSNHVKLSDIDKEDKQEIDSVEQEPFIPSTLSPRDSQEISSSYEEVQTDHTQIKEEGTDETNIGGGVDVEQNKCKEESNIQEITEDIVNEEDERSEDEEMIEEEKESTEGEKESTEEEGKSEEEEEEMNEDAEKENGQKEEEGVKFKVQMEHLMHVLNERERQLVTATQMNQELNDAHYTLEQKVKELEERATSEGDMESLRTEFSTRLGTMERKLAAVQKERDQLRKQGDNTGETIAEKDKIIEELRREGINLSKKERVLEDRVKELRVEIKSNIDTCEHLRKDVDLTKEALSKAKEENGILNADNHRLVDALHAVRDTNESTTIRLTEGERTVGEMKTRIESLEAALETAIKEASSAKEELAHHQEDAHTHLRATERRLIALHDDNLNTQREHFQAQELTLSKEIQQLRSAVSKAGKESSYREEVLRQDMKSLQERLNAAETRNEDLASAVPEATRPLLRQIDALHHAHNAKKHSWDDLLASLRLQLVEEEERAEEALKKAREAETDRKDMSRRLGEVQGELEESRREQGKLVAQLKEITKTQAEHHVQAGEHAASLLHAQKQADDLRNQINDLTWELHQVQEQRDKYASALENYSSSSSPSSSSSSHRGTGITSSPSSSSRSGTDGSGGGSSPLVRSSSGDLQGDSSTTSSSYTSSSSSPFWNQRSFASVPLEKMQSALKQKEGVVSSLQTQLSSLQHTKHQLEDELVSIAKRNKELSHEMTSVKREYSKDNELRQRYNTALILVGERTEQVEELKADLEDMKDLYRTQITELLSRVEELQQNK